MTIEESLELVQRKCEVVRRDIGGAGPRELAESVELLARVVGRLANYLDGKDDNLFVLHLQVGP